MNASNLKTPTTIAVIGDWHAEIRWAEMIVSELSKISVDHIIHVGDFGYWPERQQYFLDGLEKALTDVDIPLWWVDGNHEQHKILEGLPLDENGLRPISDHIFHIPRGFRWTWDDTIWMGFGGAASVDRQHRKPGMSWFSEEYITDEQVDYAIRPGNVNIMVSHDIFSGVPTLDMRLAKSDFWPQEEIKRSHRNREKLSVVYEEKNPGLWFHGHYHMRYTDWVETTKIVGLSCNGSSLSDNVALVTPGGQLLI